MTFKFKTKRFFCFYTSDYKDTLLNILNLKRFENKNDFYKKL